MSDREGADVEFGLCFVSTVSRTEKHTTIHSRQRSPEAYGAIVVTEDYRKLAPQGAPSYMYIVRLHLRVG